MECSDGIRRQQTLLDEVLAGLAKLPAKQREAVQRRYLEGESVSQVAAAMGVEPSTASRNVSAGVASLRAALTGNPPLRKSRRRGR